LELSCVIKNGWLYFVFSSASLLIHAACAEVAGDSASATCHTRKNRMRRKSPRRSVADAAFSVVETLEHRMMLSSVVIGQQAGAPNNTQFHGDPQRTGFNQNETQLNLTNVASSFGQVWQSPVLDGAVYATPIYADSITINDFTSGVNGNLPNHAGDGIQSASYQGKSVGVAFAATGGGSVYAIATGDTNGTTGVAPGSILWKTHLGNPYDSIDGNSIGVLGTPILDLKAGRIYVVASVTDYLLQPGSPDYNTYHGTNNFEVFALNLSDGSVVSGWPIVFSKAKLDPINQNTVVSGAGPKVPVAFVATGNGADQRGALNLSADGSTLYVDFACYGASNPGWMTTVATGVTDGLANGQTAALVSAYSSIDTTSTVANGGMWGAGGPSIDPSGNVFVTTGDNPTNTGNPLGSFGNSVLEFGPGQTLTLTGVYTPWNYTSQDTIDSDLGGGSPIVITLPNGSSTTVDLVATGGKQGNGYLLDGGNNLNNPTAVPTNGYTNNGTVNASYPASLTQRPPGGLQPDQDPSLYDTSTAGYRTYFTSTTAPYTPLPGQPGPLALFGPYNEQSASNNTAKARDTPATFTGPDGTHYVIWNGASKASVGSSTPVAPSLFLTKVVAVPGQPAYLQVVTQNTAVFTNPGAGVISADGTGNEIYWIVDEGAQRGDSTTSYTDGGPMLYAYNALTLQPLWSSSYEELSKPFGKYNSLTVEHGQAIVATDQLQAFGLTRGTIVDDSVTGTGTNQFNYTGSSWTHTTGSATIGTFQGTVSNDTVAGDTATMTFSGSQIKVYSNLLNGYGSATFSVDGGQSKTVALTPTNSSGNGQGEGDVLVYTATGLGTGTHTLTITNTNGTISIDRAEITPNVTTHATLSVSQTDGATVPSPGSVIPYTITFENAGSIINSTGVAANSVTLNDTVPANTTFDAANSTAGWTLVSGNGSGGSVYSFAAGALPAGQTGSVVFSADLNNSIPAGTSSVTNVVQISDGAGDSAPSSSRSTPIPPSVPLKLIFNTEPPATGGAGLPLSTAPEVTVDDQFGNPYAIGNSTVTLTLSSGTFVGGATTVTANTTNGVASFPSLEIAASGNYTLTATDGTLTSVVSSSILISNSAKLGFTTQPGNTVAGHVMGNVVVTEEDQNGNPANTGDNSSLVTLTLSNNAFFSTGSNTITQKVVNGVATFSGLTIDVSGDYTLQASDAALNPATSNSFHIGATATRLVFTQQPQDTNAGEAINPAVGVSFEDGFGNIDSTNTGNVSITLTGGGTFFGGASGETISAVSGTATFDNVVIPTAGNYTLAAAANGESSGVSRQFALGSSTLTPISQIDDTVGNPITYADGNNAGSRANWVSGNATALGFPSAFDNTLTIDNAASNGGDSATVTITGTMFTIYGLVGPGMGGFKVFIDGTDPAGIQPNVSLSDPSLNPTGAAEAIEPVFTSEYLSPGNHTVEVLVTGGSVGLDKLVVGPATPAIAWATPDDINYGTALNSTQLDAFVSSIASFKGTFVYTPATGTILGVGQNQPLTTYFTPSNTATDGNTAPGLGNNTFAQDYYPTGANVGINVTKATPTINWPEPASLTFGQKLSSSALDAQAVDSNGNPIAGNYAYSEPVGFNFGAVADNYPLNVTFTPTDTVDFTSVTDDNNIDVLPALPVIHWPNPADIIDGTALSSAQLNATATDPNTLATLPGTFVYSPLAGMILSPGQGQQLGVQFFPTDVSDYSGAGQTDLINVDFGPAAKLAFTQQPSSTQSNVAIAPAVQVFVEDSAGSVIPTNTDSVSVTLSSGTFADGKTSETATAANGVATFGNLTITTNGIYSLTATANDNIGGNITSLASSKFNVGASIYVNFNNGASTFTNGNSTAPFNLNSQTGSGGLSWNGTAGVDDGDLLTPGGGITVASGTASDQSAVYTPTSVSLADGAVHVASIFVTAASGLGAGDRNQLGFITSPTGAFNNNFSFVSARIYGNDTVQFQDANGGASTTVGPVVTPTGAVNPGDWLQLIFTAQETASGSFNVTMSLEDYGPTGVAIPTLVLAPVSNTFAGLTTIGTGSVMYGGFRTATGGEFTSPLAFDNFAVDQAPLKTAYLQTPPGNITAGTAVTTPVIVAVEDSNGAIVAGDTSTVSLQLSNGTFASTGNNTISVTAVNGIATFDNLTINPILDGTAVHGLTIKTADSNPLDIGFSPTTLTNPASMLAFIQPPTSTSPGATMAPPVTVAVEDSTGAVISSDASTVTLTLNTGTFSTGSSTVTAPAVAGVATFNNLVINQNGNYSITATDANGNVTSAIGAFVIGALHAPVITTNPSNQTLIAGQDATFTAAASGIPSATVQWMVEAAGANSFSPLSGQTSATLDLGAATVGENGNRYEAVFHNSTSPDAITSVATLTVHAATAPVVTSNPVSQSIPAGQDVTFTAAGTGNPTPTVQWMVELAGTSTFSPIIGANSTTLDVGLVTQAENGNKYEAVFHNSVSPDATTAAGTLTVGPAIAAATLSKNPQDQILTVGQDVVFTAAATGNPLPSVQWMVETFGSNTFLPISGATSLTLDAGPATLADSGNQYEAVFYNSAGPTATSTPAMLYVNPAPAVGSGPSSGPSVVTGSIVGVPSAAAASCNLATLGTSDWVHWGTGNKAKVLTHKAAGKWQISGLTRLGSGHYAARSDISRSVSWTGGASLDAAANDHSYVTAAGKIGAGYSFTAPADTTQRTLYLYLGGRASASTLTARLSDGSAPAYTVTLSGSSLYSNMVAITYNAASAGQKLIISYAKSRNIHGTGGTADLIAAMLP
jgi:hypothetical protein